MHKHTKVHVDDVALRELLAVAPAVFASILQVAAAELALCEELLSVCGLRVLGHVL